MNQNAKKDENFVNSLIGVSSADGKTIVRAVADPMSHHLKVAYGFFGTNYGPLNAVKDDNNVSTLLGTSQYDNQSIVVNYIDPTGNLLITL